jgi:hypothetical protein
MWYVGRYIHPSEGQDGHRNKAIMERENLPIIYAARSRKLTHQLIADIHVIAERLAILNS